MKPSKYQAAIYAAIENTNESIIIQAAAGSGKTTTAIECAYRLYPGLSTIFLAFNKSIADELKERVPPHCVASTFNSLGNRALYQALGRSQLNSNKTRQIARKILCDLEYRKFGDEVKKLIDLCKAYCISPKGYAGRDDSDDNIEWLIDRFNIDVDEENIPQLISIVRDVLATSINIRSVIDFNDQLYLPVILGIPMNRYDVIFIDESQDVSPVQLVMIKKSLSRNGRIIAIGDSNQSIYGFRGSDTGSMQKIQQQCKCKEYPLSISYRCAKNIVRYAQQYVDNIEYFEQADNGIVSCWTNYNVNDFKSDDLVMCRNTAPLITFAYTCIARRLAVRVLGREIGERLINLIDRLKPAGVYGENGLVTKLEKWRDDEIEVLLNKGADEKADAVNDQCDSIIAFLSNASIESIDQLKKEIRSLFDNNTQCMTLCTCHKAKGLESERAFILEPGLMPSSYAKQEWAKQQEINLQYVAVTRAKKELVFIRQSDFEVKTNDNI